MQNSKLLIDIFQNKKRVSRRPLYIKKPIVLSQLCEAFIEDVIHGIDRFLIDADFIMQMRSGRSAGISDIANYIPPFDFLIVVNIKRLQMPIICLITIAMIYSDNFSESIHPFCQ